jgi:type IV secretory pathway TrbD component
MTVLLLLFSPLMWLAAVFSLAVTDVAHALMRAVS